MSDSIASLAARAAASGTRPVVLIDGRSGAGKTTLARELAPLLEAQLVSLDDIYPGWDGLAAGSAAVHKTVLRDADPGWHRWDWESKRQAEWHPVDMCRPIVIEGCGALSRENRALATLGVWIEVPSQIRHRRAIARDAAFSAHWDRWKDQEDAHERREHPKRLADVLLKV